MFTTSPAWPNAPCSPGTSTERARSECKPLDLVLVVGSSRIIERLSEFDVALTPMRSAAAQEFRDTFRLVKQSG